jgi:protein-tyrosine phosphatase
MLTAESENGQLKAHNYWGGRHYGSINVHLHSEHRASLEPSKIAEHRAKRPSAMHRTSTTSSHSSSRTSDRSSDNMSPTGDAPYVTVRNFTISNSAEPFERMREVTQLHYTDWPDFGAPADPTHLLGLVEQCDMVVRSKRLPNEPSSADERPVIVHCSAGCGRTGTFCTVDSVIDMLKRQLQDNKLHDPTPETRPRNVRQPTPMDVDQRSRKKSDVAMPSPNKSHDQRSFFASAPFSAEVKGTEWLQRDDVDLIEKAVGDFRLQRLSMVQSLRQYVLCYESVLEWLVAQRSGQSI